MNTERAETAPALIASGVILDSSIYLPTVNFLSVGTLAEHYAIPTSKVHNQFHKSTKNMNKVD